MSQLAFAIFFGLVTGSPAWVPIAFAAYVMGRRQFNLQMLFALMTLEAVAFTGAIWVVNYIYSQLG